MAIESFRDREAKAQREQALARWRARFPAADEMTYLNSSSHGLQSTSLREALGRYLDSWTGGAPWDDEWSTLVHDVKSLAGALFAVPGDAFAIMPSVTAALQATFGALEPEGERADVVLGEREWVSNHHVLQADGRFRPVVVPASEPVDGPGFLTRVGSRTRLVIVSHVCYQTGERCDLARVSAAAHEAGALVFADLYQSAGVVPTDLAATNVDFAGTGFLKFLLGSPGAALLYVRPDLAERLAPRLSGWRGQRRPMSTTLDYAPGADRFVGGTWPIPSLYAARAGLELIAEGGPERIAQQVSDLVGPFGDRCRDLDLRIVTPDEPTRRGPIVTIEVPEAGVVADRLRRDGVHVSARGSGLRFSFHAYNTMRDVERAAAALARVGTDHRLQEEP